VPCPSGSSTPAGTQYCVCSGDNYYKPSNNTCAACSTLTPHCVSCTVTDNETASAECTQCESGYKLVNGVCEENTCPENTLKLTLGGLDYCVTKYNLGDYPLPLAEGTSRMSAENINSRCISSDMCCWYGNTAENCNGKNGDYSGCNRTVCNYTAAQAGCSNLTLGGLTWRLPSSNELTAINISEYSNGKGNDGLMFCDGHVSQGTKETELCTASQQCGYDGSNLRTCNAHCVWVDTGTVYCQMYGSFQRDPVTAPASVRCVAEFR
jgi:hypothetical protein